jgi:hypothetical protein
MQQIMAMLAQQQQGQQGQQQGSPQQSVSPLDAAQQQPEQDDQSQSGSTPQSIQEALAMIGRSKRRQ